MADLATSFPETRRQWRRIKHHLRADAAVILLNLLCKVTPSVHLRTWTAIVKLAEAMGEDALIDQLMGEQRP